MTVSLIENFTQVPDEILNALRKSHFIVWVGSGLSAYPAMLGSKLLSVHLGKPSTCLSAYEFMEIQGGDFLPVIVSYKGKNHDTMSVAEKMVQLGVKETVLISGFPDTSVKKFLESNGVNVYELLFPKHRKISGFISPMAIMGLAQRVMDIYFRLSEKKNLDIQQITKKSQEITESLADKILAVPNWRDHKWVILGKGIAGPSQICWQSVLAEAGVTTAVFGDVKDYTHGKFLSAYEEKNILYVIFSDKENAEIPEKLCQRMGETFPSFLIPKVSDGVFGYYSEALIAFGLAEQLSKNLGFSLGKPPKPKTMKKWSHWGKLNSSIINQ